MPNHLSHPNSTWPGQAGGRWCGGGVRRSSRGWVLPPGDRRRLPRGVQVSRIAATCGPGLSECSAETADARCNDQSSTPTTNSCHFLYRYRRCDSAGEDGTWRLAPIRCAGGLAFDVLRQLCDWKSNVKSCDVLESKWRHPDRLDQPDHPIRCGCLKLKILPESPDPQPTINHPSSIAVSVYLSLTPCVCVCVCICLCLSLCVSLKPGSPRVPESIESLHKHPESTPESVPKFYS